MPKKFGSSLAIPSTDKGIGGCSARDGNALIRWSANQPRAHMTVGAYDMSSTPYLLSLAERYGRHYWEDPATIRRFWGADGLDLESAVDASMASLVSHLHSNDLLPQSSERKVDRAGVSLLRQRLRDDPQLQHADQRGWFDLSNEGDLYPDSDSEGEKQETANQSQTITLEEIASNVEKSLVQLLHEQGVPFFSPMMGGAPLTAPQLLTADSQAACASRECRGPSKHEHQHQSVGDKIERKFRIGASSSQISKDASATDPDTRSEPTRTLTLTLQSKAGDPPVQLIFDPSHYIFDTFAPSIVSDSDSDSHSAAAATRPGRYRGEMLMAKLDPARNQVQAGGDAETKVGNGSIDQPSILIFHKHATATSSGEPPSSANKGKGKNKSSDGESKSERKQETAISVQFCPYPKVPWEGRPPESYDTIEGRSGWVELYDIQGRPYTSKSLHGGP